LQRPALRPDHLAADGARHRWAAGPRQQPAGLDHWNSGSLYNPEDGQTYRVSAELRSADVFVARIYLGVPLFGETKTLLRVSRLRSEGWC